MTRDRWGTVLIVLGVLVWVPFSVLLIRGEDPPFLLFLPFHLAGVLTGSYLRRGRRGPTPRIRRLGNVLIYLGVAAWTPYFALKSLGYSPDTLFFLPFHLAGVVPGVILRYWLELWGLWARLASRRVPQRG